MDERILAACANTAESSVGSSTQDDAATIDARHIEQIVDQPDPGARGLS